MMGEINSVMSNLEVVTDDLAKTDLTDMLNNVNDLVVQSEDSISDAMVKIDAIDIDALNGAIEDLGKIVAPLAKLFGK